MIPKKLKIVLPIKKNKKLFDSNFNLLEDVLGNNEISQILEEFVHLDLESPKKLCSFKS